MPPFELQESYIEVANESIEGMKFAPVYDGQEWSLQRCGVCKTPEKTAEIRRLEADVEHATRRFLDGLDSEESDGDGGDDRQSKASVSMTG